MKPIRKWRNKIKEALQKPRRKEKIIAMDETKLKVNGRHVFVWCCRDIEKCEISISIQIFYFNQFFK